MSLIQDVRFALRGLKQAPIFTTVAVLSVALGIGANTAIFTLLDQVLLRLLPVKDPQQLVLLTSRGPDYGNSRGWNMLSYPMYSDFRDRSEPFSGVFCRYSLPLNVTFNGRTERASGELVSGTYFPVLGVGAALGRLITAEEDKIRGGHPVAVLSFDYWKTRFAGDPGIVGKSIVVNGYSLTVIGVSQEGFHGVDFGAAPQIHVPVMMKAQMTPQWNDLDNRRDSWVTVFARLRPGVSLAQAKAALQPFYHGIREQETQESAFAHASSYARQQFLKGWIDVTPASQGRSPLRNRLTRPLWVLMAIVALVLIIACGNVANLLIDRATARQKEIAIRLALGASRRRVVGQLLVESALLAVLGGAVGVLLATWMDGLLLRFLPNETGTVFLSSSPDTRILGFNFAIALMTGLLFGLAPALQATKPDVAPTLKDQAGAVLGGGAQARLRKALIVAQVTFSLLLLIGAGLFIRSLRNLKSLDPGFKTENLIAFGVDPSLNGYSVDRIKVLYKELQESLSGLPGVKSAALSEIGLLEDNQWISSISIEGYVNKPGENMSTSCNTVGPAYFATMGIPIVLGRDFTTRDDGPLPHDPQFNIDGFRAVIANEKFVKRYFGDSNPIGRRLGFGGNPGTKTPMEIVGVVKNAKYTNMRDEIPPELFFPYLEGNSIGGMTAYVRTTVEPAQMGQLIRDAVRRLDANLPVYKLRTVEQQMDRSLLNERLVATLSTFFGLLATTLAIIGLYGVMAYTVNRRTREIGIRMALGAISGNVMWLVMGEVVVLVAIGVAIGMPAAWGLSRLVQTQLYGVAPNDPFTLALATALLVTVACAAGYIPALRAARIDPLTALRYE
jgi:predicted permease